MMSTLSINWKWFAMEFNTLKFFKNNSQGCVLLILPNTSRVHGHHQFDHLLLPMPINGNFSLLFAFLSSAFCPSSHIQIWKKKKWDEWGRVFKWVHYKRWCEQTQRTTSNQMKCIPSLEEYSRSMNHSWTKSIPMYLTQTKSIWRGNWQGDFIPPKITRENERSMNIIRS